MDEIQEHGQGSFCFFDDTDGYDLTNVAFGIFYGAPFRHQRCYFYRNSKCQVEFNGGTSEMNTGDWFSLQFIL